MDRSGHYPKVCPHCRCPAYVGCVPAAVSCSNPFCKHAEKKRPPEQYDLVTIELRLRPGATPYLQKVDGKKVLIRWIYERSVEVVYEGATMESAFVVDPDDVVELRPYLIKDADDPYGRVPKELLVRPPSYIDMGGYLKP